MVLTQQALDARDECENLVETFRSAIRAGRYDATTKTTLDRLFGAYNAATQGRRP